MRAGVRPHLSPHLRQPKPVKDAFNASAMFRAENGPVYRGHSMSVVSSQVKSAAAKPSEGTVSASSPLVLGLVALAVLVGLGLRYLGARSDLWLDEVWSLRLVAPLAHVGEVFWGISHDNNHFLNSVWLYLAGPDQSALFYRLPSILMGGLSVVCAALIGARRGQAEAVIAAALVACALPFVHYGSEARGYSGIILAMFAAVLFFDRLMDARGTSDDARVISNAWLLGASIGFGALSHLTMLMMAACLGGAAVALIWQEKRVFGEAFGSTLSLFRPSLLLLFPAMGAMAAGVMNRGTFEIGGTTPFSVSHFLEGFGGLLRFTLGFPESVPLALVVGTVLALLALAVWLGLLSRTHLVLVLMALVVLPGVMFVARLSNVEYPRYFLVCAVILIVAVADLLGALWRRGGLNRPLALGVLALILAGQISPLQRLMNDGRGGYSRIVALMGEASTAYDNNHAFKNGTMISFYAERQNRTPHAVSAATFCEKKPEWYVLGGVSAAAAPEALEAGPSECRARFGKSASFGASDLSGWPVILYQRQ